MGFPYQYTEGLKRKAFKIPTPVGIMIPTPRRVEEVFNDYKGRQAGLIKALTIDVEKFYRQCDPEKEHLCLFAFPNKTWQVKPPAKMVPTELPEPLLGINFTRDLNRERDWLIQVALHSDAWLLSVAFHIAAKTGFDKNGRERLFEMINSLPTVVEVVTRAGAKQENDDEIRGTLCGACGIFHCLDGFWICCDVCDRWFHGTCVKITPATAEYIEHYKCPTCSNEGN